MRYFTTLVILIVFTTSCKRHFTCSDLDVEDGNLVRNARFSRWVTNYYPYCWNHDDLIAKKGSFTDENGCLNISGNYPSSEQFYQLIEVRANKTHTLESIFSVDLFNYCSAGVQITDMQDSVIVSSLLNYKKVSDTLLTIDFTPQTEYLKVKLGFVDCVGGKISFKSVKVYPK